MIFSPGKGLGMYEGNSSSALDWTKEVIKVMVQATEMTEKIGNRIVRELIAMKDALGRPIITKYRLQREMGLSSIHVVDAWLKGEYFSDMRLERLLQVREKWLVLKQGGIYSK